MGDVHLGGLPYLGQVVERVCVACGRPFTITVKTHISCYRYCHRNDCKGPPKQYTRVGRRKKPRWCRPEVTQLKDRVEEVCGLDKESERAIDDLLKHESGHWLVRFVQPLGGAPSRTYLFEDPITGLVKVGHSFSVRSRLNEITCARPGHLSVLGICKVNIERQVHKRWVGRRVVGEWFVPSLQMLEWCSRYFAGMKRPFVIKTVDQLADSFVELVRGWRRTATGIRDFGA